MINSQSKSLGLKDSSLTKTEAKTQNSLNNTNDFDYCLKVRHVVDIYMCIYIYIYIDIVPDVPDTSGESKNNTGAQKWRQSAHITRTIGESLNKWSWISRLTKNLPILVYKGNLSCNKTSL